MKYALVTGGGRGIGLGIAQALKADGYTVAITGRSLKAGEHNGFYQIPSDISNASDRIALVETIRQQFGKLDVLVNNAGVAPKERKDMLEYDESDYDYVMDINLKGTYFLTQRVAKLMMETLDQLDQPTIINISSISEYTVSVNRAQYCISKAGIGMLTKVYAARLAEYGIAVHEVRPGIIATDMTSTVKDKYDQLFADGLTPIARWGTPDDIAKAVRTLCSGALPYSTGQVIDVDGGFHLRRL